MARLRERSTNLKTAASAHFLPALSGSLRFGPIQLGALLEELRLRPRTHACEPVRHLAHDLFHHGEMFQVVMGLEESDSGVELDQYAS